MAKTGSAALVREFKGEKDARKKTRLHAVCVVRVHGLSVAQTAELFHCDEQSVRNWIRWYDDEGAGGLGDRPRPGRPPKARWCDVRRIFRRNRGKPPKVIREKIRRGPGVGYHMTSVRRKLHDGGYSRRAATHPHERKPPARETRRWQREIRPEISRLRRAGIPIVEQDEAFFIKDPVAGSVGWMPIGERLVVPYSGTHERLVVYSSITDGGRVISRVYEDFTGPTFVRYLREVRRRLGGFAMIMDNASPHTSEEAQAYFAAHPDVIPIYLPSYSPMLNAVEELWRRIKPAILATTYYRTLDSLHRALTRHLRALRNPPNIMNYIFRRSL